MTLLVLSFLLNKAGVVISTLSRAEERSLNKYTEGHPQRLGTAPELKLDHLKRHFCLGHQFPEGLKKPLAGGPHFSPS